jgi:hypothetical protein
VTSQMDNPRAEFEQLADDNQLHGISRITCGNYFMEGYDRGRSAMAKEAAQASTGMGWVCEDELPKWYPYDAMFPFSRLGSDGKGGARVFPVLPLKIPLIPKENVR